MSFFPTINVVYTYGIKDLWIAMTSQNILLPAK
jgi:hypothetical protein